MKIRHGYFANLLAVTGSVPRKDFALPPLNSVQKTKSVQNLILKLGLVAGAIGAVGPIIRQTHKCVRYYVRLCALLY